MHRKLITLVIVTSFGLVALADGCSADQWSGANSWCCPTDPKNPEWDDPQCVEGRAWDAYREDAGIDGGGCAPPNWPQSRHLAEEAVASVCVPNAPDNFDPPQPLWVGAKADDPGCSPEIGAFGNRQYNDIEIPAAGCPACVCGPVEGSCYAPPNQIQIRAGYCEDLNVPSTDFSASEEWDGSCTSANALKAGAECPENSGVFCAQSIYTSALPDPVEGCKPFSWPVPSLHSDRVTWNKSVLSCSATPIDLVCPDHDSTRFAVLPKGWRHCVRHQEDGIHACPSESKYKNQVIAYGDKGYIDTRRCTECECKATGGICHGTFNVYEDEQCTKFLSMNSVNSETYDCANLVPGVAVGSKELVDLTYVPGTCEPSGGLPLGTVETDDDNAQTWCCLD